MNEPTPAVRKPKLSAYELAIRRDRIFARMLEGRSYLEIAAAEAITPRQRRRVARAFEHFLAGQRQFADLTLRFDVMLVAKGRLPRHLCNAWRSGE